MTRDGMVDVEAGLGLAFCTCCRLDYDSPRYMPSARACPDTGSRRVHSVARHPAPHSVIHALCIYPIMISDVLQK